MEELGIPELTSEQIEEICTITEEKARKHVISKVSAKQIERLNISAEIEGTKPAKLTIDVDINLSTSVKNFDAQKLADEAVKEAFKAAEKYLRELTCHSQT